VTEILVVAGAGGVGKTTVSAAGAVMSAAMGVDTLVVTVDPARRLGDALGVGGLGNHPSPVPGHRHLWAAMLDVAASWEGIVTRHAEPEVAQRLVANPYFRAIADRFPAAQAYAAGEQMAEFADSGDWDRVVVDTPPAAGGIDFMLAPHAMQDLLGSRLLSWLTGAGIPGRRALYRVTARPMLRMADTVLGGPLLEDIAEFLLDLRTVYDGLSARAVQVERHLRTARTVLVTNASPTPLREVRRFLEELPASLEPAAVIFNRMLPTEWASAVEPEEPDRVGQPHWVALHDNLARWGAEARREADTRRQFAATYTVPVATVPLLTSPPTDLEGLAALADASPDLVKALFG
jgi:anion-transporting  ArsA/GET3 family ATPase